MRILVLGAGGVGGFFGGRLVEKGEDVTFLVRSKRKKQLEERGLVIRSVNGDFSFQPKLITKEDRTAPFDVILFSTKAYHLKRGNSRFETVCWRKYCNHSVVKWYCSFIAITKGIR